MVVFFLKKQLRFDTLIIFHKVIRKYIKNQIAMFIVYYNFKWTFRFGFMYHSSCFIFRYKVFKWFFLSKNQIVVFFVYYKLWWTLWSNLICYFVIIHIFLLLLYFSFNFDFSNGPYLYLTLKNIFIKKYAFWALRGGVHLIRGVISPVTHSVNLR